MTRLPPKKNGNRVFYVGYFIMSCTGFAYTVLTRCSYGFPLRLWFLVQFSLLQAIFPTAAHEKSYVQNGFEWRVWSPLSQRKCLFISVCVLEISFISVFFLPFRTKIIIITCGCGPTLRMSDVFLKYFPIQNAVSKLISALCAECLLF